MLETLLLTIPEVAEHLRVSTRTVHRLIASKSLLACKVGRSVRIRRMDLERFLDPDPTTPDNTACTGPGVRNREENVCHTVAKIVPFGGRLTSMQADKELDELLEQRTIRRPKHSKPNGSSKRSEQNNGAKSPAERSRS